MRTTNPVLSRLADAARATAAGSRSDSMTTAGVAGKAAVLLAVVLFSAAVTWQQFATGNLDLLMPAMLLGGIGGFIVGMIASFKPQTAPWAAPIYASLQGIFLGAVNGNEVTAGLGAEVARLEPVSRLGVNEVIMAVEAGAVNKSRGIGNSGAEIYFGIEGNLIADADALVALHDIAVKEVHEHAVEAGAEGVGYGETVPSGLVYCFG